MNLVKVKCAFCGKEYFRQAGRVNEAKKLGWNQYCSKECQGMARTTRIEKACGNPNCSNKVWRALNQFKRSKSGLIFCSHPCAAVVNNRRDPKRRPKFKVCLRCGKRFRKSIGNLKYCSMKCRGGRKPNHTPQELINMIGQKAKELQRIPSRREMRRTADSCRSAFGSWNNAIIAAGFQPNRSHSQRMYKRTNTKALDGHVCDSVSELIIDNWLTKNNIFHEKNVPYPRTNHKADWAIFVEGEKIFIEYFGLANDSPRYDRAIKEKKNLCRKYRLKLIAIYPQDLYPEKNLSRKLQDKFRKFGSKFAFGDSGLEPLYSCPRDKRLTN